MSDKIREVAVEIASELFTNGSGEHAKNLNLILESGRYVGGWCESAVADVIERKIRAAQQSVEPTPPGTGVCSICRWPDGDHDIHCINHAAFQSRR